MVRMSDLDSSDAAPPPSPTYTDRLVENLSKRISTAKYFDLLTREIFQNPYLQAHYYQKANQLPLGQATALIITLKVILKSIASTRGIDSALLTLTKALVGGAPSHVATSFDGYFILLKAFNLRLYESETLTPVVRGKIFPRRLYTLRRIDPETPAWVTENPPESGRIEIDELVQHWYNLTFTDEYKRFHIGNFVNDLCGAVAMSILESRGLISRAPPDSKGTAPARAIEINRSAIGSAAGLPSLHLLSIR